MGTLAIVVPDHSLTGGTRPAASSGKPTPVGFVKPKASIHLYSRSAPILMPIVTAPTLLDHCRISRTEYFTVPLSCDSLIVRSSTVSDGGSVNGVPGLVRPSASAPEIVTSLKIDPGS